MRKISVGDAEKQLRHLFDEVERGEEVVITRGDGTSFKLIPLSQQRTHPTFGSAKGKVWMSDDFDTPLVDLY